MSIAILPGNTDQWRTRYNLPLAEVTAAQRTKRFRKLRNRGLEAILKPARVAFVRPLSVSLIALVWVSAAAYAAEKWHVAHESDASSTTIADTEIPVSTIQIGPNRTEPDDRPATSKIDTAVETSLVALRGYILTDSEGFRIEWQKSLQALKSSNELLKKESESWTDGRQLLQLATVQRTIKDITAQQELIANLVGTADRYPGRRFYDEHVAPDLEQATKLSANTLNSVLSAPSADGVTGGTNVIDLLADLRGNVRQLKTSLPRYLESRPGEEMPADLQAAIAKLDGVRTNITAVRYQVPPSDQINLEKIAAVSEASAREIRQTIALHQSQRWDYADFAFKQQILPAAVDLLAIIRKWPTSDLPVATN